MNAQSNNHPYTILRIKRKRTDEPLDALVVESRARKKKSKGGRDVFQFVKTVEETVWEDKQLQLTLQDQISKLSQIDHENVPQLSVPVDSTNPPGSQPSRQSAEEGRRYTVVPTRESVENTKFATSPPKVISAKDLQCQNDFRMYDAVPADQKHTSSIFDSDMDKFLPMLQNYLRMNDEPPQVSVAPPAEDYVWDVFYKRPYTSSEWNSIANIGKLEGLPPSVDDPYSSGSESEEEDEADEDSNAEEYYKNDYPDEEDSNDSEGSDIFHESSEAEDDFWYDNPRDEDNDWR